MPSEAAIMQEYVRRFGHYEFTSLEDLLTNPQGMGLKTATPAQRAICRIAEGRPLAELTKEPGIASMLGITQEQLQDFKQDGPPRELVLLSGIRTAKSLLAAAIAIRATQTCDISHLRAGEIPRFSILSISKDLANVILQHLMGSLLSTPALSRLIYDQDEAKKWLKDGKPAGESVMLKHPSGKPVQVMCVAGRRAGASLVARWSIGVAFDEAPRMQGAQDATINLDDARAAVLGRLVPGAQLICLGSPWSPMGPVYNMYTEFHGKPTRELVLVKAPGPLLNPYWWTPERVERMKAADAQTYRTDVLAEFCDVEESLLSSYLEAATRSSADDLPPNEGQEYVASMDPATRSNAWTLIIATRRGEKKQVAVARQWQGTPLSPLRPRDVLRDVRDICYRYRIRWCYTDQFAADALQDLAENIGLELVIEEWNKTNKVSLFLELRAQMAQGLIELPPDPYLQKDLRLVKRRVTQSGVSIIFPQTTDKRHCDYAPALARAIARWISDVEVAPPTKADDNYGEYLEEQMLQRELDQYEDKKTQAWWDR